MEEKSILKDSVTEPVGVVTDTEPVTELAEAVTDTEPVTEPAEAVTDTEPVTEGEPTSADREEEKKDVSERLREAGDTISRASAEAESFKRRREKSASTDGGGADKRREDEMKRLAEEEKKRESAAEEKRAALEYAESYRARIRSERESSAARKREEERARARAEERLARERELKEDIEREREAARARSERAESLLERVGGDVDALSAKRETSADAFFAEPATDLPITTDISSSGEARADASDKAPMADASSPDAVSTSEKSDAKSDGAAAVTAKAGEVFGAADSAARVADISEKKEEAHDYVITVDGGHSERDLLYIEGAVACEIAIGTTAPAPTPAPTPAPAIAHASSEEARAADTPVPEYTSTPYGDFTDAPTKSEERPEPVARDTEKSYEEASELIRHSAEEKAEKAAKGEDNQAEPTVYPDPEPAPKSKKVRKTKAEREEERRAMLEFERDSRSGKPFGEKARTADDRIIDELEDDEATRRDTAAAEVGDSSTRTESADTLEAKPVFDRKALEKNKQRQIKNDNLLIEHRIYNDIRRLEMDTRTGDISFTAKIEDDKERRKRGRKKTALANTRRTLATAKKYENADNERYYQLVLTDIDKAKLPKSTDKDELRKTREELLALLKRRDELNIKLIELYSISEGGKGKGAEGRFKAILAAKKSAYKKQIPTYKKYERARISRADKEKLYPLLDERTELYGELARVNYALKREGAKGLAKKELKRERAKITRKLDENKQAIIHYERKALRRADKETEKNRAAIIGWSVLGVIAVGALLVIVFWNQIQPWLTNNALPWLGDKFGQLVAWVSSLIDKGGASAE